MCNFIWHYNAGFQTTENSEKGIHQNTAVGTLAAHSGGSGFKSRPGHILSVVNVTDFSVTRYSRRI